MCSSRHSHYNSGLFCMLSCKKNEIEKRASVTLANGCRVGASTSKRDRICNHKFAWRAEFEFEPFLDCDRV